MTADPQEEEEEEEEEEQQQQREEEERAPLTADAARPVMTAVQADQHGGDALHPPPPPPPPGWRGNIRWIIAALGFGMEVVCYADRTNLSLALVPMSTELGYSEETTGVVLSSFFVGYAGTQVAGGWAAARWGGKPVLLFAVFIWSCATVLTPPAAAVSVPVLLAVRVAMGVGEGVSLPTMHHLTAVWCPLTERSRFVAFCNSGQYVGTVAALLCSPMVAWWWPSIFYFFGAVGLCWCGLWQWLGGSSPKQHRLASPGEKALIAAGLDPQVSE
eukprot:SAG22_NODE_2049_length_3084_cov_3.086767_1_plen_273_part_00